MFPPDLRNVSHFYKFCGCIHIPVWVAYHMILQGVCSLAESLYCLALNRILRIHSLRGNFAGHCISQQGTVRTENQDEYRCEFLRSNRSARLDLCHSGKAEAGEP